MFDFKFPFNNVSIYNEFNDNVPLPLDQFSALNFRIGDDHRNNFDFDNFLEYDQEISWSYFT